MKGKKLVELHQFMERLLVDYYSKDSLDKMLSPERRTKALSIILADISVGDAKMILDAAKGALVLSGYKEVSDSIETLKDTVED